MSDILLQLTREALLISVYASAPMVLASLVVGVMVAIIQATTQIQDATLSFVPKLIAVILALMLFGPWSGMLLIRFSQRLLLLIASVH